MITRLYSAPVYFISTLFWILSTASSTPAHRFAVTNSPPSGKQHEVTPASSPALAARNLEHGPPGDSGTVFTLKERFADVSVWEGQSSPMRVQLDSHIFDVPPSTTGNIIASAGPITYFVKLESSSTPTTAASSLSTLASPPTTLPSWLKFDPESLEFTGVPPTGTYSRTTYLTVLVSASSVPGFIQATDRLTIQVNVHTLALSTAPSRSCSSSAFFFAGPQESTNNSNQRQNYLPDIVVDPQDRGFRFEITSDLFRIDGCTAPSISPSARAGSSNFTATTPDGSTRTTAKNGSSSNMTTGIFPSLTQLMVSLSVDTARQLSIASNAGLPSWMSFDPLTMVLSGAVPAQVILPKLVLEIHVADNFNSSKVFKLQIFINTALTPPFIFEQPPVADLWTKTGEAFEMDMDLGVLLEGPHANASIESQFWFEMVDLSDRGQNLSLTLDRTHSPSSKAPVTVLTMNHSAIADTIQVSNDKSLACGIGQLWNQEDVATTSMESDAKFPTWFNHTISDASNGNGLKVRLSGLVPCGVVLRVRWILVNSLGQWTSAEFLILASESGPPDTAVIPTRKDKTNGGDDKLGPVGIKIAIGFALGIPVVLLLWFIGRKYCGPPSKKPEPVENKPPVLEDSPFQPRDWSRIGTDGLAFGPGGHHRQHTSEVVIHPDSEYRSSYEDDPSVGHRDSYSEKYVAENSRTHSSSGEDGEGGSSSSQSQRISVMGWIFNKEEKATLAAMHAQTLQTDPYQRSAREQTMFSLRRLSMGYPFESNRFGFVNSNRHSLYDAGTGTGTGASTTGAGVGSPSGESHTTANDNYDNDHEHLINHVSHQRPSTTIDMPLDLGTTASTTPSTTPAATEAPMRPAKNPSRSLIRGPERRGGPRQKKQLRASASAIDLADMHLTSLGPLPPMHTLRPCHSFASSGTGYMASMSAGNTSIEDDPLESEPPTDEEDARHHKEERIEGRQKPTQHQEEDGEEAKNRRRLSRSRLQAPGIQDPDHSVRISWTPNQFPLDTAVTITDEDTNNATNNEDDDTYMKAEFIPRSDSGAVLLGSSRSPTSSHNVDSVRHQHTASNSSASSCGTPSSRNQSPFPWGKLRSAVTPGSSRPVSGLKKGVDLEGSACSSISMHTPPQEKAQIHGRQQLSVQTSLLHRRSIVEMIQSKEAQVSPLSALSASLPFQDALPVQDGEKEGDTKWMSVQCNYPVRSVSAGDIRRTTAKDDDNVEKMNGQACGPEDEPNDVKDSDPRHFSLQSELGIIEHQPSQDPTSVTVTPRQTRPLSAPMLSHQNISFRPALSSSPTTPLPLTQSRVHALSGCGRHSSERARPISYPILIAAPPVAAAAPRTFVKATIGTAFHHTSLRNGLPSSPYTSPRTSMHVRGGSNGSLSNFQSLATATSTLGEYRAYLVADPNDLATQETLPGASRHRSSTSLSSIDFGDQQGQSDRPKRKLPDWIQFNNKMRSLWGRPAPGSAGEWHVSLVQSRMVDVPTVPTVILPQPPVTAGSTVSTDLRRKSVPALTGDTSATTATSATTPTNSLFSHGQSSMAPKEQEEREVQVELVMLLVREPGDIPPKTPPLGATRWGSPLQFGSPRASRPSLDVPSPRPSLDLGSCVTSTIAPAAPCTPSPLVRVMTNTDASLSPVMGPTTPTPTTALSQLNTDFQFKKQEEVEPLIRSESTLAPSPISPMPASAIPAPTRTVGQRVLAERRRIEAAMQQQQQKQQSQSNSSSGNSIRSSNSGDK